MKTGSARGKRCAGCSVTLVAVCFDTKVDYSLPTKEVIREAQVKIFDQPELKTQGDLARMQQDGEYRLMVNGESVVRIFDGVKWLQARQMVGA